MAVLLGRNRYFIWGKFSSRFDEIIISFLGNPHFVFEKSTFRFWEMAVLLE